MLVVADLLWPLPVTAAGTQRNIILVLLDDAGYGDFGATGNGFIKTGEHLTEALTDYAIGFRRLGRERALGGSRRRQRPGLASCGVVAQRCLLNTSA